MTQIPDQAVQDAINAFWMENRDEESKMLAALTAAAPYLTASVEVGELEWSNGYKDDHVDIQRSPMFGGIYQIREFANGAVYMDIASEAQPFVNIENAKAAAQADYNKRILSALKSKPVDVSDGSMTPEELRLENLKQMAKYDGPIISFECRDPYYLASCDCCGWVGSSELCGTDSFGDDSDVYCPRCHSSGVDCGKIAGLVTAKPVDVAAVRRQAFEEAARVAETHSIMMDVDWWLKSTKKEISAHMCLAIAEAFRALSPAEPVDQWQDIATTSKDGNEFLTWNGRRQHVARFDKVENAWVSSFTTVTKRLPLSPQPTHFAPLPAAPTSKGGA